MNFNKGLNHIDRQEKYCFQADSKMLQLFRQFSGSKVFLRNHFVNLRLHKTASWSRTQNVTWFAHKIPELYPVQHISASTYQQNGYSEILFPLRAFEKAITFQGPSSTSRISHVAQTLVKIHRVLCNFHTFIRKFFDSLY